MNPRAGLWATRELAMADLAVDLKLESEALDVILWTTQQLCEDFERLFLPQSKLARVSGLTGIKGRNLALCCYSLALDGHAQESGAVLRSLLESIELLAYLREVPEGVDQAINSELPSAGVRAKRISGEFKRLREHLNQNASHFGFTKESLRHLVDSSTGRFRVVQPHRRAVLRANMGSTWLFTYSLAFQLSQCFEKCSVESGKGAVTAESYRKKVALALEKGSLLFFTQYEPQGG